MDVKKIMYSRYGTVVVFGFIFLLLAFITRTVLLIADFSNVDPDILCIFQIYTYGLFYDFVTLSYFVIPLILYLFFVPNVVYRNKIIFWIFNLFFIVSIGILVFSCIGEGLFWEEFGIRYNFIAVDYLVYTHEVISNINESYNMPLIISGILFVSFLLFLGVRKHLKNTVVSITRFKTRLAVSCFLLLVPLLSFYAIDQDTLEIKDTTYANELAHNGIYQLFSAFRNNELDYKKFYLSIPDKAAFANLRRSLKTPNSFYISNDPFDIRRQIKYSGEEKRYNIMLITVESLSASFFTRFGNNENITPNLDNIVKKSLFFTHFFATGTRTVRGMEALTLSLPPTPGSSIVKRPNNEGLFSLGSVLGSKGYLSSFIYSGEGYFDNMNYFFGNNGYKTFDRKDFTQKEVTFENAWGVCDEDLYAKAMQVSDDAWKKGKPFYNFLMTTSNHRPYTYPDGKIDIPSHSGRSGAVKYTDYAIGKFFREARKHPWFENTIFVVVGDHCASSAGKTVLPVANYHIPLIIYAPGILQPGEISTLSSQIDFAPTLMGLLNTSYVSKFFGKDILLNKSGRAFIGTYQQIGMLHDDLLTVEMPTNRSESFNVNGLQQTPSSINQDELKDLISYYQSASYLFHTKKDKF